MTHSFMKIKFKISKMNNLLMTIYFFNIRHNQSKPQKKINTRNFFEKK